MGRKRRACKRFMQEQQRFIDRITAPLVRLMERYYPDLFLFIILITLFTFTSTYLLTGYHPREMLVSWGDSLADILGFAMQMALMVMISHALAHTDIVQKGLNKIGSLPKKPFQAYSLVTFSAGAICFVSWPLGLIAGGIIARKVGESARHNGIVIHYPLLVASAFCGNVIWHMGYSASAPLFVATESHSMLALTGGVIQITDTVFTAWNLSLAVVTLLSFTLLAGYLRPKDEDAVELPIALAENEEELASEVDSSRPVSAMENSRFFTLLLGACLSGFLVFWFTDNGFNLNLNVVNWTFMALTLLFCRSARHFMQLFEKAAPAAAPLIIAYPFYAGIIGIMSDSGMASMLSTWFASIATADSLPLWAFTSAMIVNMFIPSGGAQWIVQGPIFIEAANTLNVDLPLIVMSIAYGDQLTNLLQPLPAIPLLALAGLRLKHIMGYSFLFFLAGFLILGTGLAIISYL